MERFTFAILNRLQYHCHSASVRDFVAEPHTGIVGAHRGTIMNLVDRQAKPAQAALLDVVHQNPDSTLQEVRRLILPAHHAVLAADVNLTRLGAVLAVAYEKDFHDFAELLLLEKLGPRTCRPCRWLPKSYMEGPHVFPILRGSALFCAAKTAIRSR